MNGSIKIAAKLQYAVAEHAMSKADSGLRHGANAGCRREHVDMVVHLDGSMDKHAVQLAGLPQRASIMVSIGIAHKMAQRSTRLC